MKKDTFKKFIQLSIDKGKRERVIYDNGLDLINFLDEYSKINNILLCSIYDEHVTDIINDFIIDSVYNVLEKNKKNYIIYSDDDEIIADCSTIDALYEFAESTRLKLIFDHFSYEMKKEMTEDERMNIIKNMFNK